MGSESGIVVHLDGHAAPVGKALHLHHDFDQRVKVFEDVREIQACPLFARFNHQGQATKGRLGAKGMHCSDGPRVPGIDHVLNEVKRFVATQLRQQHSIGAHTQRSLKRGSNFEMPLAPF